MRFTTTTTTLALTLALTASSTPLKRQTPSRFALFFAASAGNPETEIVVTSCGSPPQRQCLTSSANSALIGQYEPLILDQDFVFTSSFGSPTGGQALIVDIQNSQSLDLTVAHSGFTIPSGFTHDGFSVVDGVLAFNGSTSNFYACQLFVSPGGDFPLFALDPVDTHGLGEAACSQRTILAKTSAVGK